MAIVQISKIQHRRGLRENLPNLGSAELGWALDTRQLYIGNGSLLEGAPTIGMTEILTEYSDILGTIGGYTYSGETATGYPAQTGADVGVPVARSLQDRLDDLVSVKAFGAYGDGSHDDTDAINRALFQLYCVEQITQTRKTLLFPAGTYLISDTIKIPTYATLVGEGKSSTVIKQTAGAYTFETADSLQQTGSGIGLNSATPPSYIYVQGITFEQATDYNIGLITRANNCVFNSVRFKGPLTDPADAGTGKHAVTLASSPVLQTQNIRFVGSDFTNITYAVVIDDDTQNLTWDGCYFHELYRGFKLGEATSGSGSSVYGPTSVRIVNSYFHEIASIAIYGYDGITGIYSGFNVYSEVGNSYAGTGNPVSPIIIFSGNENYSIGDRFERNEEDNDVFPIISHGAYSVYVQYPNETRFGTLRQKNGGQLTLNDGATATSTGISFKVSRTPMLIVEYSAERNGNYRSGKMLVSHSSSAQSLDDEFSENASLGLTFSLTYDGGSGSTLLKYTTTSTGYGVTFTYAIRYLK